MFLMKIVLCFLTIFFSRIEIISGGSCYAKIEGDGKCSSLVANDVGKDECCSVLGLGYDEEISSVSIFMLAAGIQTEACKPCQETCDTANCGEGKRCIMKKGVPKCVCAPSCKVTVTARKSHNSMSAQKIGVVPMQKTKRKEKRVTTSEMQNDQSEPTLIVASLSRIQNNKQMYRTIDSKKNHSSESLVHSASPEANFNHQKIQINEMSGNFSKITAVDSGANVTVKKFLSKNSAKTNSLFQGFHIGNVSKFTHYSPICGSDGKTYKNECQMRKRACRQENKLLDLAYKGHCQSSCKFIKCSNGKHCIEDQNSVPQCITCPRCNKNVTNQAAKMVCGADGVSYRNYCELRKRSCKLGRLIPLLHRGPCTEALSCNHCSKTEKCLPDLMTYQPKCVMCNYKCPRKRRPIAGYIRDQVCGKNNITYFSLCHLIKDSCTTGFNIELKHEGPCSKSS